MQETYRTIVVGGGQAGLAAAHHLSAAGEPYLMLDEGPGFGHSWRSRWDSLRLFTPAKFSSLPGMRFPGEDFSFPTKEEAAGYLAAYAKALNPPIRFATRVDTLDREGDGFVLGSGSDRFRAKRVIVAAGAFRKPSTPECAARLDPKIRQVHSSRYQNPAELPPGPVLVVGAGNSGAEIAVELAHAGRRVWLSGRDVGRIPASVLGRAFGGKPYWWLISRMLSVDTPVGRKVRMASLSRGAPLISLGPREVADAGVVRVGRVQFVDRGRPRLEDGQEIEAAAVVWATGYRPDYSWIRMPVCDERGYPRHERGVSTDVRGLYFLGLLFQVSLSSSLLGGVGKDAQFITRHLLSA